MAKKKKYTFYSTDPDYEYQFDDEQGTETVAPHAQKLRVSIDRKKRGGKKVTLVSGFIGQEEDLKTLGKQLKAKCGVGGSAKDGEILIQGDQRNKIVQFLKDMGYSNTKKSGG